MITKLLTVDLEQVYLLSSYTIIYFKKNKFNLFFFSIAFFGYSSCPPT